MLVIIEPVSAEALAELRAPRGLPAGSAFHVISMETGLAGGAGYKLSASVVLGPDVASEEIAAWLWTRVGEAKPVVRLGGTRARIGEPAALAWLIDRARSEG